MKNWIQKIGLIIISMTFLSSITLAENLAIWGSTTCQKRFLEPGAKALAAKTGVKIKVLGVGTGKGMMGLIEGKALVSAASSPLSSAIKSYKKSAKKAGHKINVPENLVFHELFKDIIIPIVHKSNPIKSLTWEQLSDIHTGKIKNWKQVGGPNWPIRVVSSHEGSATKAVFQKQVMKKQAYVKNAKLVTSTRREISEVSKFKGAIGAVSEGFYKLNPGKTKPVKTKEISRPLALITVGAPKPAVQKVIDYFRTAQGQKHLK